MYTGKKLKFLYSNFTYNSFTISKETINYGHEFIDFFIYMQELISNN